MIDRLDIHAYADGELARDEIARLESDLATSPEAARELEAIQGLKRCLQAKAQQPAPGDAWKLCLGRLDELDRVKRTEHFVGKYAWALCLVLFAVILGGGLLNRLHPGKLGIPAIESAIGLMTPMQAPPMAQPQELRSFLEKETGQTPPFTYVPARVIDVACADQPEGRIVRIRLQDSAGMVALFIIPNVAGVEGVQPIGGGMYAGQIDGHNCVVRPDSGCAVVVIGDRDFRGLRDFALSLYRR